MNGGKSAGMGKSEKAIISLLVFIEQDLYTLACIRSPSVGTFSLKFQRPPISLDISKHMGSSPSSRQLLTEVRPEQPAPIIAILLAIVLIYRDKV